MMVYRGPKRLTSRKAIAKRKAELFLDWVGCACNNCPMYKGFYQSDNKGNWKKEIQNPKFYVCNHCGALISVPKGLLKNLFCFISLDLRSNVLLDSTKLLSFFIESRSPVPNFFHALSVKL